jgi:dihydropteroate synthase
MPKHRFLDVSQPRLMAILNVTPDSFADGGQCYRDNQLDHNLVLTKVEQMIADGAEIIDIGGESTRPGAQPVPVQEELERVIPELELIAQKFDVAISVDTSNPAVMSAAALAGAHLINDVRALSRPGALEAAANSGLIVCLMHMQGEPGTMQNTPHYNNVVTEVKAYLQHRVQACLHAGIEPTNLWIDPGFGFGKTLDHNLALLLHLSTMTTLDFPLMVGFSRKSMIGKLLGRDLPDRLPGSLALALIALQRGASILRVHDIGATRDIIDTFMAIEYCGDGQI